MRARITISMLLISIATVSTITAARAEIIGFGTSSSGGPIYRMVAALGTVAGLNDDLEFRLRPHTGTGQMLPVINSGELACGAANSMELTMAHSGSGIYEGKPQSNLRLVGVSFPFRLAMIISADSSAMSAREVKGLRFPGPFSASPIADILVTAILANAGLTTADVDLVPVAGFREVISEFDAGRVDIMVDVVNAPYLKRLEQKLGKLRVFSIDPGTAAVDAMQIHLPVARAEALELPAEFTGSDDPIHVMAYDFFVFCNQSVSDQTVSTIAKTLHSGRPDLAKIVPSFGTIGAAALAPEIGVPYHPGALKYYRDAGLKPAN